MIIRGLVSFYLYYGDAFIVECPDGLGRMMNLFEVSRELSKRLASIFLKDSEGRRLVHGSTKKFQKDPNWRDLILFYEYLHGDNSTGIDASHQTGWTGLVARLIHLNGALDAHSLLEAGRNEVFRSGQAARA